MNILLVFCLFGLTLAQQQTNYFDLPEDQWTRPETPEVGMLGLPSGASLIVPNINTNFDCTGRAYGYFADVNNDCKIYHICHPSKGAKSEPTIYHYTHVCPATTRFDQKKNVCLPENHPELTNCADSHRYYPNTEQRFNEYPSQEQHHSHSYAQKAYEQTPFEHQKSFDQVSFEGESNPSSFAYSSSFGTKNIPAPQKAAPIIPAPVKGAPYPIKGAPAARKTLPVKSVFTPPIQQTYAPTKSVHQAPLVTKTAPHLVRYAQPTGYVRPAQLPVDTETYTPSKTSLPKSYPSKTVSKTSVPSKTAPKTFTPQIAQKAVEYIEEKPIVQQFEQKTFAEEKTQQKYEQVEEKPIILEKKIEYVEQKPFEQQKFVPFEQEPQVFEKKTFVEQKHVQQFEQKFD